MHSITILKLQHYKFYGVRQIWDGSHILLYSLDQTLLSISCPSRIVCCCTSGCPEQNSHCSWILATAHPPTIKCMWLVKPARSELKEYFPHLCWIMASAVEEAVYLHKSVIWGHHIYKAVWNPVVGEVRCLALKEGIKHDCLLPLLLQNQVTAILCWSYKTGFSQSPYIDKRY